MFFKSKNKNLIKEKNNIVAKWLQPHQFETVEALVGRHHLRVVTCLAWKKLWDGGILVEAYVKGHTLDEIIRFFPKEFSEEEVIRIGIEICEGLKFLHGFSPPLIHGDIKPQNIMLCEGGRHITIIDVDEALVWKEYPAYRQNRGTVGFCCKSQKNGGNPDISWDIYGLGKTVEFLYLGVEKKRKERQVNAVIKKAKAEGEKDSFVTVAEVQQALEAILYGY